jgi:hypothetical protein
MLSEIKFSNIFFKIVDIPNFMLFFVAVSAIETLTYFYLFIFIFYEHLHW